MKGKQEDIEYISNLFGVEEKPINSGLKYLGLNIKPNNYSVTDWLWIFDSFHKNIFGWEHSYLTLGGRVSLKQLILQKLVVYSAHIYCLPTTIIWKINGMMEKFIWVGSGKSFKFHLTKMENLTMPKSLGG